MTSDEVPLGNPYTISSVANPVCIESSFVLLTRATILPNIFRLVVMLHCTLQTPVLCPYYQTIPHDDVVRRIYVSCFSPDPVII